MSEMDGDGMLTKSCVKTGHRKSKRLSFSILKKSPSRDGLNVLDVDTEEKTVRVSKKTRKSRRVSFAETCEVQEFAKEHSLLDKQLHKDDRSSDVAPTDIAGLQQLLTGTIKHAETADKPSVASNILQGTNAYPVSTEECVVLNFNKSPTVNDVPEVPSSLEQLFGSTRKPLAQKQVSSKATSHSDVIQKENLNTYTSTVMKKYTDVSENVGSFSQTRPLNTKAGSSSLTCHSSANCSVVALPQGQTMSAENTVTSWDTTVTKVYSQSVLGCNMDFTYVGNSLSRSICDADKTRLFTNEDATAYMDQTQYLAGHIDMEDKILTDKTIVFDNDGGCDMEITLKDLTMLPEQKPLMLDQIAGGQTDSPFALRNAKSFLQSLPVHPVRINIDNNQPKDNLPANTGIDLASEDDKDFTSLQSVPVTANSCRTMPTSFESPICKKLLKDLDGPISSDSPRDTKGFLQSLSAASTPHACGALSMSCKDYAESPIPRINAQRSLSSLGTNQLSSEINMMHAEQEAMREFSFPHGSQTVLFDQDESMNMSITCGIVPASGPVSQQRGADRTVRFKDLNSSGADMEKTCFSDQTVVNIIEQPDKENIQNMNNELHNNVVPQALPYSNLQKNDQHGVIGDKTVVFGAGSSSDMDMTCAQKVFSSSNQNKQVHIDRTVIFDTKDNMDFTMAMPNALVIEQTREKKVLADVCKEEKTVVFGPDTHMEEGLMDFTCMHDKTAQIGVASNQASNSNQVQNYDSENNAHIPLQESKIVMKDIGEQKIKELCTIKNKLCGNDGHVEIGQSNMRNFSVLNKAPKTKPVDEKSFMMDFTCLPDTTLSEETKHVDEEVKAVVNSAQLDTTESKLAPGLQKQKSNISEHGIAVNHMNYTHLSDRSSSLPKLSETLLFSNMAEHTNVEKLDEMRVHSNDQTQKNDDDKSLSFGETTTALDDLDFTSVPDRTISLLKSPALLLSSTRALHKSVNVDETICLHPVEQRQQTPVEIRQKVHKRDQQALKNDHVISTDAFVGGETTMEQSTGTCEHNSGALSIQSTSNVASLDTLPADVSTIMQCSSSSKSCHFEDKNSDILKESCIESSLLLPPENSGLCEHNLKRKSMPYTLSEETTDETTNVLLRKIRRLSSVFNLQGSRISPEKTVGKDELDIPEISLDCRKSSFISPRRCISSEKLIREKSLRISPDCRTSSFFSPQKCLISPQKPVVNEKIRKISFPEISPDKTHLQNEQLSTHADCPTSSIIIRSNVIPSSIATPSMNDGNIRRDEVSGTDISLLDESEPVLCETSLDGSDADKLSLSPVPHMENTLKTRTDIEAPAIREPSTDSLHNQFVPVSKSQPKDDEICDEMTGAGSGILDEPVPSSLFFDAQSDFENVENCRRPPRSDGSHEDYITTDDGRLGHSYARVDVGHRTIDSSLLNPIPTYGSSISHISLVDKEFETAVPHTFKEYLELFGLTFNEPNKRLSNYLAGQVGDVNGMAAVLQRGGLQMELEPYQWACEQMEQRLQRFEAQATGMSEEMLDDLPAIFRQVPRMEDCLHLNKLKSHCEREIKSSFKKWRLKTVQTIAVAVKEEEDSLHLAVTQLKEETHQLDMQLQNNAIFAKAESEKQEKKEMLDQLQQEINRLDTDTQELKVQKSNIVKKIQMLYDEKNELQTKMDFKFHSSEKATRQLFDLKEQLWILKDITPFEVETWDGDQGATLLVLSGTVALDIQFGTPSDGDSDVTICVSSRLEDGCSPLGQLIVSLAITAMNVTVQTPIQDHRLPQFVNEACTLSLHAEHLLQDLADIAITHPLQIHLSTHTIKLLFSSLPAHLRFTLSIELPTHALCHTTPLLWQISPSIGVVMPEDIAKFNENSCNLGSLKDFVFTIDEYLHKQK